MYKHILVPVAPSHERAHEPAIEAARKLLDDGGKISVLSVLEEIPAYVETYVPEGQIEKNLAEVSVDLKATIDEPDLQINVVSGHSANSILAWAEGHGVDCIILSSHRPGLSDYFLGSTAARVVRHAQCTVLVMR